MLYLGDSFTIIKDFEEESFDAIITDPPFGIGKIYKAKEKTNSAEKYWEWFSPMFNEIKRVLKPGGLCAIWQTQLYFKHFWEWYGDNIHIFIAAKNWVQIYQIPINHFYDPIIMFFKEGAKPLVPTEDRITRDFIISNTAPSTRTITKDQHPCPRPLDVCEYIVKNFTIPGGSILDPFMGSGSIGVAAERLGREFVGIEIEPDYYELAKQRIEHGLFTLQS